MSQTYSQTHSPSDSDTPRSDTPNFFTMPMQDQYGEAHFVNSPVLADRRWRVERQNFVLVSAEWLPTGEVWSMDYENMQWVKTKERDEGGDLPF